MNITNLHADNMNRDRTRCAIGCTVGADRFHVWAIFRNDKWQIEINGGRTGATRVLHCNSVANQGEPGWHKHRALDADAAKNRDLIAAMMSAAPALIASAIAKDEEEQRQADEAARAKRAREVVCEAGPALLAALEPLAMAAHLHAESLDKIAAMGGETGGQYHLAAARWRDLASAAVLAIKQARGEP